MGKSMIEDVMDRVRKQAEDCNALTTFLFFEAIGGGTGSGFGALLRERLAAEFGKKTKISFPIYPYGKLSTANTYPYNVILANHKLLEYDDMDVVLDNQALYNICGKQLGIETPQYKNLNGIVAKLVSSLTSGSRFDGSLNQDISEMWNHNFPYPRLHYVLCSYGSIVAHDRKKFSRNVRT
jgi:tubulin alpha